MLRWMLVVVVAHLSVPWGVVAQGPAETGDSAGRVTSSGIARVHRALDHVDVVIGVERVAPAAGEAHEQCASAMDDVLRAIRALDLGGADLKTGVVDLRPRYEHRSYSTDIAPKILGYTAVNTVRVRTTDLKAVPRILDAALKNGANRVDGVTFGIREALEAREEALRLATRAAKRKAGVMAAALDGSLGKVVAVTETTQQFGGWSNRMGNLAQVVNEEGAAAGEDAIEPGMIEIVVEVMLTFTLVGG